MSKRDIMSKNVIALSHQLAEKSLEGPSVPQRIEMLEIVEELAAYPVNNSWPMDAASDNRI